MKLKNEPPIVLPIEAIDRARQRELEARYDAFTPSVDPGIDGWKHLLPHEKALLLSLLPVAMSAIHLFNFWPTLTAPDWTPTSASQSMRIDGIVRVQNGYFGLELGPDRYIDLGCSNLAFHASECGARYKQLLRENVGKSVSAIVVDADRRANSDYVLLSLLDAAGQEHQRSAFQPFQPEAVVTTLLRAWWIIILYAGAVLVGILDYRRSLPAGDAR